MYIQISICIVNVFITWHSNRDRGTLIWVKYLYKTI